MLRTIGPRRRLAALLVPIFLVVHLVCFCMPAAVRATAVAPQHVSGHDCCTDEGQRAPQPEHDASCAHCGAGQLGVAPAPTSVSPPLLVTPVVMPDVGAVATPSCARRSIDASRGSPPLPSPLRQTCVLIV